MQDRTSSHLWYPHIWLGCQGDPQAATLCPCGIQHSPSWRPLHPSHLSTSLLGETIWFPRGLQWPPVQNQQRRFRLSLKITLLPRGLCERRPVPVRVRETWARRGAAEIAGVVRTVSSIILEDRREKEHAGFRVMWRGSEREKPRLRGAQGAFGATQQLLPTQPCCPEDWKRRRKQHPVIPSWCPPPPGQAPGRTMDAVTKVLQLPCFCQSTQVILKSHKATCQGQ